MSLVSIGVPVYNGESMLAAALESVLGQTYEEIEVIVCDNASTDRTPDIAKEFAARDPRLTFYSSETNQGAAWNFNRTFHLSRGEFFKWAAHDDLCGPRLVEKCVLALSRDPGLVLCHSKADELDSHGGFIRNLHCPTGIGRKKPSDRFESVVLERHASIPIFGVIRSDLLRRTPLIGRYVGSDWVLLCQLALMGRLFEIPEVLFWRTEHADTSQNAFELWERLVWFDSSKAGKVGFPSWRMVAELFRAVGRTELPRTEKDACYRVIGSYAYQRSDGLWRDLFEATKHTFRKTRSGAQLVDGLKRVYRSHPSFRGG